MNLQSAEAKSNEEATAMGIDQSKDDEHDKGDNKPEQSTREELSAVDAYRAGASNDDDGDNLFPAIVAGREKGTMDSGDADVRRAIADAEAATFVSSHTTKNDNNFVEVRRSGRTITAPARLIEETGNSALDNNNYSCLADWEDDNGNEFGRIGSATGGGFTNTRQLHAMELDQALKVDRAGWLEAVEKEYQRMMDNGVFEFVRREEKPVDALILSRPRGLANTSPMVH